MSQESMVPVTILTGFLGAGKTTLLNRILREHHGRRIAVIENEFGEAGIDNDLLLQDRGEQIVEMNNGCLCCTVRGDLSASSAT
jgi:G3E family GTPase